MALSTNPEARQRQLNNLRSFTSETGRAQALKTGIGSGHLKECTHTLKNGNKCRRIAAFGTPKCRGHGAKRYKGTPNGENEHLNKCREAIQDAPDDLKRTKEWQEAQSRKPRHRLPLQAELKAAWDTAQMTGDWKQWRQASANAGRR